MGTVRDTAGTLRVTSGMLGAGQFAAELAVEQTQTLTSRRGLNGDLSPVGPSEATLDARGRLAQLQDEFTTRDAVLERDRTRLSRAEVRHAALALSGTRPMSIQFDIADPTGAVTVNGAAPQGTQVGPVSSLVAALREDETTLDELSDRGEASADGSTVTVNAGVIADSLTENTPSKLDRELHWAQIAHTSQFHETMTARHRLTEASAVALSSEITDQFPDADVIIATEDGSNAFVVDRNGTVITEQPDGDVAAFFAQHISSSPYRTLPAPPAGHPAAQIGYPQSVMFSIPGIRSLTDQTF
jgi:hypothetical protein